MSRCEACPAAAGLACRGGIFCGWAVAGDPVHLGHIAAVALADAGRPPARQPGIAARAPDRDALAAARLAVLACDYRLDAVGLERGSGCGCAPATRCLLGRGKWPDDPGMVDYGDCLGCTAGG